MAKATTMGPMKIKESASYRVFKVFNAIILTLISVAMLYPFLYLVAQSFSSTQAIVAGQVGLIPKDFNISTYKYVITDGKFIPYYGNTIVYSIIGTVCALLFSALLAYPLSKAELYGGKAINKFIIFTMYFSGGMIPAYMNVRDLSMIDSLWALIIPGAINTYNMMIMRSAFAAVPDTLYEAAHLDGATHIRILSQIYLPLSGATLAVMVLYYGVGHWNSWFNALVYLPDTALQPLQLYLRRVLLENTVDLTKLPMNEVAEAVRRSLSNVQLKYAMIIFTTLPVLFAYPFFQKHFVKGIMVGSLKG